MDAARIPSPDTETLVREFKEFAYIVSHDLSTPLRAMVEFSRLLKSELPEDLSDDHKLYLSMIVQSGEKMQNMLAGLVDYSRLNTMAKPISLVDCNRVLEDCRTILIDKIKKSKAVLEVGLLPTITMDLDQFMQLWGIVLDNALMYRTEGKAPHIQISAAQSKEGWTFTIRDNGIGIDPQFHARIFQPFQRLHTDSEYPGIGMGLTLANKIVERHAGRIWVESVTGQGSSFIFTIPHKGAGL